jgi:hypothetical protein
VIVLSPEPVGSLIVNHVSELATDQDVLEYILNVPSLFTAAPRFRVVAETSSSGLAAGCVIVTVFEVVYVDETVTIAVLETVVEGLAAAVTVIFLLYDPDVALTVSQV